MDPTVGEISDIKTAVSEAVTNCIIHAYRDVIGMIYISVKIFENGKVVIRIRDKGCGIEDVEKAKEPLYSTGGEERAGLGFMVMESFMDQMKVTSKVGKGTVVVLQKEIERKQAKGCQWIIANKKSAIILVWSMPAPNDLSRVELSMMTCSRRDVWVW